jgi:hypothetical protein
MVFYTVDSEYDGNDYWTQPKINRQMFHYGEDKLVQGRLYPQDNDGDGEAYTPYRNIVQSIMSVIFDFPNLWNLKKGTSAASLYIQTKGTHYVDYVHYDNCSLSRIKDRENENSFIVGARPICINCGCRHDTAENINCCNVGTICECCGYRITDEDDECWVDDYCYCQECATWCEVCSSYHRNGDTRWVESENRYVCEDCLDRYYAYCECCHEYVDRDYATYVEDADGNVCDDCLEAYYTQCEKCGKYFRDSDMHECEDGYYCDDCYVPEEDEDDEEEAC